MKPSSKNPFLLPALIVGLALLPAGLVTAQTFTNLHSFTGDTDGAYPQSVILSGNILYGTADGGGSYGSSGFGSGAVFAINADGTGFTNLHTFTTNTGYPTYINSDGANPGSRLILSGNTLYGTARSGGTGGAGTIFAVNTDGTGFTNLHSFAAPSGPLYTNSDGADPVAGLILSGNILYGTAEYGGSSGSGTVFAVNTDGTGFTNLYNFTATSGAYPSINGDGAVPVGDLILSGNTLYGTTYGGGSSGSGTVFSLSLPPPPLTITPSGTNVILTWPTYAPEVTLQSTTNLVSPAGWNTVSPASAVVSGLNTVTNPISDTQRFYRLSQ
ncbi:MAG TPA: choice-of-anchor tandem repeat GloVer-containing protein [Candidatus Limnocylindrales bacterium]|nr:choice-of-anchor tandem repeat GloVer-containing protein [Candidatus Limnocylindrales bacterium]